MAKYHNRITEVDGIKFHSKAESSRYQELKILEKYKKIKDLVLQPKYGIIVNGIKVFNYIADFEYTDDLGKRITEDCKGFLTAEYRLKKKCFEAQYNIKILETK